MFTNPQVAELRRDLSLGAGNSWTHSWEEQAAENRRKPCKGEVALQLALQFFLQCKNNRFILSWFSDTCSFLLFFQINMTVRASLQKLKQNIGHLKDDLLRTSSTRRMYPFFPTTNAMAWPFVTLSAGGTSTENPCMNEWIYKWMTLLFD